MVGSPGLSSREHLRRLHPASVGDPHEILGLLRRIRREKVPLKRGLNRALEREVALVDDLADGFLRLTIYGGWEASEGDELLLGFELDGRPYFFASDPYTYTPWGPRPDYGRAEVREYINDTFRMWLDEYHISGFRWDAPGDGRWLTRDPLRERAGLNLYDYVGNDPLNRSDTWGLVPPGSVPPGALPPLPPPPPPAWGRYSQGPGGEGGVCSPGTGRPAERRWFKHFVGQTWAWIQGFIGTDRSDGTYLSEPGNSGANGVRADSGGSDGSDGGPNAVAGVRG